VESFDLSKNWGGGDWPILSLAKLAGRGPMLCMAEMSPLPCLLYTHSHKIKNKGEQINLVSFESFPNLPSLIVILPLVIPS